MNKCPRCGKENPAEIHTCTPLALRLAAELDEEYMDFPDDITKETAAELRRLYMLNAELVEALEKAMYEIADWGAYASPYFQEKHDLQGSIDKVKSALAKAKGEGNELL